MWGYWLEIYKYSNGVWFSSNNATSFSSLFSSNTKTITRTRREIDKPLKNQRTTANRTVQIIQTNRNIDGGYNCVDVCCLTFSQTYTHTNTTEPHTTHRRHASPGSQVSFSSSHSHSLLSAHLHHNSIQSVSFSRVKNFNAI